MRELGINQLGAVYEGLMSYTGFFAEEDLYEVAKDGDPSHGTWVLPVAQADGEYSEDKDHLFIKEVNPYTGDKRRKIHTKASFVYGLSGQERQRSASYYTPEILTGSARPARSRRADRRGREPGQPREDAGARDPEPVGL